MVDSCEIEESLCTTCHESGFLIAQLHEGIPSPSASHHTFVDLLGGRHDLIRALIDRKEPTESPDKLASPMPTPLIIKH
jgi:hypothetical protein